MLPEDLFIYLNNQIPCRQLQIRQIASVLDPQLPNPRVLVLHGLEATGKSLVAKAVLEALPGASHAIVRCRECVTVRHLLERTVIACKAAGQNDDEPALEGIDVRCENISALVVHLQRLLQGKRKFILLFDGIDRQREAPQTLLPAIARLGEIVPGLTVALIVTAPPPHFLHVAGVPHIHFTSYNKTESITIASRPPLPIFDRTTLPSPLTEEQILDLEEDDNWLWTRFCSAVWDSLGKAVTRDVVNLRNVCERLWPAFVQPIRDETFGTRDLAKLMIRNRSLFQGETALTESILPVTSLAARPKSSYDLPYYTKYLLLAAYLASYNPARTDVVFFMKAAEKKRRKKGGGTALGRARKYRRIQRRLLGPQPFVLMRLLSIFHAIVPHDVAPGGADILTQVATLAALRMLVRAAKAADVLEAGTKWRVNVGWDFILGLARGVRFEIEEFLAE